MKIIGIVAEYNPFHNGHHYQIEHSLKELNADGVVAIMSGNFVQRGMPAFVDKWTRTKTALEGGINLVIELPVHYATSSAEQFAKGALTLLNSTGVVTHLSFGSESEDLEQMEQIATLLVEEPDAYKLSLKHHLGVGLSYPAARSHAIDEILFPLGNRSNINQSNMILAIEYLKSIKQLESKIKPFLVKRIGKGYHDEDIESPYASATAIRKAYFDSEPSFKFSAHMPRAAANILDAYEPHPLNISHFEKELLFILRRASRESLAKYREVNEGLDFKLKYLSSRVTSYDELVEGLKSKRYTQTKINRLLINILLGIEKREYDLSKEGYLRILGFDDIGRKIIHDMKETATLPIITNINKVSEQLKSNPLLELDIKASDLYAMGQTACSDRIGARDHTEKMIIL
jgi:predicted nucleotidyltransferase